MNAERVVKQLRFYIGNIRYNMAHSSGAATEFNRGRLEAFEDALQMLTGSRGEDIE